MSKGQAFGMREPVTYEEARETAERVFHKDCGMFLGPPKLASRILQTLTAENCKQKMCPPEVPRTRRKMQRRSPAGLLNGKRRSSLRSIQTLCSWTCGRAESLTQATRTVP